MPLFIDKEREEFLKRGFASLFLYSPFPYKGKGVRRIGC
jgi:hypothetical protein